MTSSVPTNNNPFFVLRRSYSLRQPASFDVEKKEYLCPLCDRLCNTALPLLPGPSLPTGILPSLTEDTFNNSVNLILKVKHQSCSDQVQCDELPCQSRLKDLGAMSSKMEDESDVPTHSENLLSPNFLVLFEGEIPSYNDTTKSFVENFASVSSRCFILYSLCTVRVTFGLKIRLQDIDTVNGRTTWTIQNL